MLRRDIQSREYHRLGPFQVRHPQRGPRRHRQTQFLQDIAHALHQLCAFLHQAVRGAGRGIGDPARHREYFAPLLQRRIGGDQRPAVHSPFHDHHSQRQSADDAVAQRKLARPRWRTRRKLRHHCTVPDDLTHQTPVLGRIHDVGTTPQHGDRPSPRRQRAAMRGCIAPPGHPADHRDPACGEIARQLFRHRPAVLRRPPRTDNRNRGHIGGTQLTAHIQT